jgi:glutamate formiminotransferase
MGRENMQKIIECVPNFSEGRRQEVIDQVAEAVRAVDGVRLLDVAPNPDHNRTVLTFVGSPDPVADAAFAATAKAAELINMGSTGESTRASALWMSYPSSR